MQRKNAQAAPERKAITLEIKADDDGTIEGYASVFNVVDHGNDIVMPGAFAETLMKRTPKFLWQHKMDNPIGVIREVREDARGLFFKGQLALGVPQAKSAYELAKMGGIDGVSIGYRVTDYDVESGARQIKACDLFEISMVTMPMQEMATLTAVKSVDDMTDTEIKRHVEAALKGIGVDRRMAKAMAAGAMDGRDTVLRDAGLALPEDDLRDADELKALLSETLQKMEATHV